MKISRFGNEKAPATNRGERQNLILAGGKNGGFDSFNFRENAARRQCKKCGSDYMKYSYQDLCQDCLQKVEYIIREHSPSGRNDSSNRGQR